MEKEQQKMQTAQDPEIVDINGVQHIVARIPRTNKVYKVRMLTPNQMEDIAKLLAGKHPDLSEAVITDKKIHCKAAAIYLMPGFWKRKLTYWFKWRWFYYVRQYDYVQLQPILSAGNGSTPYVDFLKTMNILNSMRDTQMHMTRQEAEKMMQQLASMSEKNANGNVDDPNKVSG